MGQRTRPTAIEAGPGPTRFRPPARRRPLAAAGPRRCRRHMAATQSHAMRLHDVPTVRLAFDGKLEQITRAANPIIWTLFTAVILGVLDAAIASARVRIRSTAAGLRPYEQVEWSRAELDSGSRCRRTKAHCAPSRAAIPPNRSPAHFERSRRLPSSPRTRCFASRVCWAVERSRSDPTSLTGSKTFARWVSCDHRGASRTTACSPPRSSRATGMGTPDVTRRNARDQEHLPNSHPRG